MKLVRETKTVVMALGLLTLAGCLSNAPSDPGFADDTPTAQNNPPTISGNPQNGVTIGGNYSFMPTASDPDGDALEFGVENLPSWATFEPQTGEILGQPTLGDVGVYTNIVVSVSDGMDSASLSGFNVTVSQAALGSMTLSWTPPTENTDGTVLTDLSGYRIYYGVSMGDYPNSIEIPDGLSTYVIENLMPDTYFIVATSVNSTGVESAYSNVAIKTVGGS